MTRAHSNSADAPVGSEPCAAVEPAKVEPDERLTLVYQESLRAITTQQNALVDVRGRAAQILTAASVVTSVLGGLVQARQNRPVPPALVALAAFLLLLVVCIWIILPRKGWSFLSSATILLHGYVEAESPADINEMHRSLALYMERHWDKNQEVLNRRLVGLQVAAGLLGVSITAWLFSLLRG